MFSEYFNYNVSSGCGPIEIRELPKVVFRPRVIRANSEANDLVKFFEERPPNFGEREFNEQKSVEYFTKI